MLVQHFITGLLCLVLANGTAIDNAPKVQDEARVLGGRASSDPTATINIGTIIGTQTALPSAAANVNKFLGVPFAISPPVRFGSPEPVKKLNAPLKTQSWRAACFQEFALPLLSGALASGVYNQPPPLESEDCLYLNVYAPAGGSKNKAVFFWIPAGFMAFGNAGQPAYDGSAFAAYHDIVVVVPAFRTNVFGFPGSPQLKGEASNLGFQDQRLALQWVQDNIAAFGGDPTKVTVGGISSGGWNAELLLYTYPPNNPPFRAAIIESGQSIYLPLPANSTAEAWDKLTTAAGCFFDKVNCMRLYPAIALKTLVENLNLKFNIQLDNVTVPSSPYKVIKSGNFVKVPILTGQSSQEGRFYAYSLGGLNDTVSQVLGKSATGKAKIPGLLKAYAVGTSSVGGVSKNDYEALSALLTDLLFTCGQSIAGSDWSQAGTPVWQYVFNASFPNIAFSDDSGAYHASDVRAQFQSYPGGPINPTSAFPSGMLRTNQPATQQQRDISAFVNQAWANFINNPTQGPGWDQLKAGGKTNVGVIGNNGQARVQVVDRADIVKNCGLFLDFYSSYSPGVPKLTSASYA